MFKKMRILNERVEHLENECTHLNFKLNRAIEQINDLTYAMKEMKYLLNSKDSSKEEKSDGNE